MMEAVKIKKHLDSEIVSFFFVSRSWSRSSGSPGASPDGGPGHTSGLMSQGNAPPTRARWKYFPLTDWPGIS